MMLTSCDVLVVGGGVAGTAAAVAAARAGAATVLVEKDRYLGGTGYAGLLQHICGLYQNGETFPSQTINAGISREIEQALIRTSPERTIKKIGQVYVLPYSRKDLLIVLRELCDQEKNLHVYEDTAVTGVDARDSSIKSVVLRRKQEYGFYPRFVIDCSGEAAVATMAGLGSAIRDEERQLAGYVVQVTGLVGDDDLLSVKVPYHLAHAVCEGKLAASMKFTTFSRGDKPGEGFCKLSIDGEKGAAREEEARNNAESMIRYLASVLPAFQEASIIASSHRVMDREGSTVPGEYTLTELDVVEAQKFPDGVVRNSWPVELWDRSKGTIYKYVPKEDYYEIPFRSLKVVGVVNMLAAGRCISATHEALGSVRVMGACMATGEKAGQAAAFWVKNGKYPEGRF